MNRGAQEVLDAALALSDGEQLQLIAALVASVDERSLLPPDESWREEVRRGSDEYDAGGVTPISWTEVKERARRAMRSDYEHKSRR